jgi:hypothetical protein
MLRPPKTLCAWRTAANAHQSQGEEEDTSAFDRNMSRTVRVRVGRAPRSEATNSCFEIDAKSLLDFEVIFRFKDTILWQRSVPLFQNVPLWEAMTHSRLQLQAPHVHAVLYCTVPDTTATIRP